MRRVKKTKGQDVNQRDAATAFVEKWTGKGNHQMTTDEIMAMTRGED